MAFQVFSTDKELQAAGASPYHLGSSHYWFDYIESKYLTDEHSIERTKKYLLPGLPSPLVIDIESWDLNDETRDDVYRKLKGVTDTVRSINPGWRIGWYRYLPIRQYWTPINERSTDKTYRHWTLDNRQNIRKLGRLFDFLAPSIYSFYPEHSFAKWKKYASGNLSECIYARKPTYAFVWPSYHAPGTPPVISDMWRSQLRYLRDDDRCDGVFIWDKGTDTDWRQIVVDELLTT